MTDGIPVAEAIEALRSELETALAEGEGRSLRFEASSIELTLQAAVTTSGGGRAGIRWWLLDVGAEASRESATTQTITMTLVPKVIDADGRPSTAHLTGQDGRA